MSETLEVFLLDDGRAAQVIALGRRGDDVAIETLPIDADFKKLTDFRALVENAVLGKAQRPKGGELRKFGEALFAWLFRGTLSDLYARLPAGNISLQILSTRPDVKGLPWEYLQAPDRKPVPHRERCIVRILPSCGIDAPPRKPLKSKIRVLLVVADPVDQEGVVWDDVKAVIERAFVAQLPGGVELTIVEGASRDRLTQKFRDGAYDIFHFLGHGDIRNGEGCLVLVDLKTKKSDYLTASQVATLVAGTGIRLVLLSACLTSAGDFADDFSIVAAVLMRTGIPAVVANQLSIPNKAIAPFVGALYAKLLQTGNIDQAVMDGRVALAVGLGNTTGTDAILEWGIPTLYRLVNGANLFSI